MIKIIDMKKPKDEPYILLQTFAQIEDQKIRIVHIINLGKKSRLTLGRGNEADVRIKDISVSRIHSEIRMIKD